MKTEILVIGSGIAGCISAISAASLGKSVIIITKTKELLSGNTPWAQGGIIYKGILDSKEKLKRDIMTAGDGHCWESAVDQLCELGPKYVEEILIKRLNVDFDKNTDNQLHLTAEGAHSEPRIIHSKDKTGLTIHQALINEINKYKNNIPLVIFWDMELIRLRLQKQPKKLRGKERVELNKEGVSTVFCNKRCGNV